MTDPIEALRDDIAFMRSLTADGRSAIARDAKVLVSAGAVFGTGALLQWLATRGPQWATVPPPWLWLIAGILFFGLQLAIYWRARVQSSAASRAIGAAWAGVGTGIIAAGAGLAVAAVRLDLPVLGGGVFPLVLFALYGAAWTVAFAVKRREWVALVAVGCFAAALTCGFTMGTDTEWLVLALGLYALVALPGVALLRQARVE